MPPCFPTDVLFIILLRLPAPRLQKLKRVCKEWRRVINDPAFIDAHLAESTDFGLISYKHRSILLCSDAAAAAATSSSTSSTSVDLPRRTSPLPYCCRGLLLFRSYCGRYLHVANPVTMRCRTLPPIRNSRPKTLRAGMGFLPRTGEYKVAVLCREFRRRAAVACYVLTLGPGPWREVPIPFPYPESRPNTFVESAPACGTVLHWLIYTRVVSFDLDDEKFNQTAPLPDGGLSGGGYYACGHRLFFVNHWFGTWILSGNRWEKVAGADRDDLLDSLCSDRRLTGSLPFGQMGRLENGRAVIYHPHVIHSPILWHDVRRRVTKEFKLGIAHAVHQDLISLSLCQIPPGTAR